MWSVSPSSVARLSKNTCCVIECSSSITILDRDILCTLSLVYIKKKLTHILIYFFVLFSHHQFCNCCLLSTSGHLSARQNGTKKRRKEKKTTPERDRASGERYIAPLQTKTKLQKKIIPAETKEKRKKHNKREVNRLRHNCFFPIPLALTRRFI